VPATKQTAKELARQIIDDQPEDSTYDDLVRELIMYRIVQQGLDDIKAGRTITHEELEKEVETWFK